MEKEATLNNATEKIRSFFETDSETLHKIIRSYVWKAKSLPKTSEQVDEIAAEILSQVFIEAIEHADRFDSDRPPRAWLLGIASKLILRRQDQHIRHLKHEVSAIDDETTLFDRLASLSSPNMEEDVALREQANTLIAQLTETDQIFICVALKHNLSGNEIAKEMNISPGNARVKLHRILEKMRNLVN